MKILPLIRIANYYETDRMGIIHHSNYIRWFEEARVDYLDKIGMPYFEIEKMGVMMPVLEAHCEYKDPVHFGDTVVILTKIKEFKGARLTISYEIYDKETKKIRTKGETKHCFVHAETFQPLRLRTDYPKMNERILKLVGADIVDWESNS
ncbi:thioesterase family protein [Sinanaerobacter sp. ZZT-01]|uniref:acyl-CoA thioesterase n=1 Tax=Sinanaerobacter sp. ZZT-01 TaxID=3111540 RepID=UPI002D78305D|nr:thioesterase family protein [Sinanaerobacter sp. ZZT-01]WRR93175.1 thioesterase family protein [Sinanaerobacter sp. ZZT-01]